jgi:hypothetical protein
VNVKKIGAGAAIFGALVVTGFSISSGVANADPQVPASPGMIWKLDRGHDGEGRDWDGHWRGEWDGWRGGPGYYNPGGPCVWVPPAVAVWVPPAVC